jgi:catechol-2,3-dioxygenase
MSGGGVEDMDGAGHPAIAALGHVGLRCFDVGAQLTFYTTVLGLHQTDGDAELGVYFLSSRPAEEHHELLLSSGRDVEMDGRLLQQLSFRCGSLDDVVGFLNRFEVEGVRLDMVVSHGNAIGVYFFDPEGNRCEVYWRTGLAARQPYVWNVDLHRDRQTLLAEIEAHVAEYSDGGFTESTYLERTRQDGAPSSRSSIIDAINIA